MRNDESFPSLPRSIENVKLPTLERLRNGDYYAFICRATRRRRADVYAWPLNHRLPTIPIPLAIDDREVPPDLQVVFDTACDRAGYDYSLNCKPPVVPAFTDAEAQWAASLLNRRA